jgi:hypothetical protein
MEAYDFVSSFCLLSLMMLAVWHAPANARCGHALEGEVTGKRLADLHPMR